MLTGDADLYIATAAANATQVTHTSTQTHHLLSLSVFLSITLLQQPWLSRPTPYPSPPSLPVPPPFDPRFHVQAVFPTSYRYTWRSAHVGDDTVVIDYTAPHYCSDCYYVVGVYGYR